jgi:hypothetical protein
MLAMKDIHTYLRQRSTFLHRSVGAAKHPFPLTCENRIPYTRRVLRDLFLKSLLDAPFQQGQDTLKGASQQLPPLYPRKAGAVI